MLLLKLVSNFIRRPLPDLFGMRSSDSLSSSITFLAQLYAFRLLAL